MNVNTIEVERDTETARDKSNTINTNDETKIYLEVHLLAASYILVVSVVHSMVYALIDTMPSPTFQRRKNLHK
jgi:hypothetical protein